MMMKIKLNGNRFLFLLRVYRIYRDNGFKNGFRSAYVLVQNAENSLSPSYFGKVMVKEMIAQGLLKIDSDGLIKIDRVVFEDFIQHDGLGLYEDVLCFVDEISTIRV